MAPNKRKILEAARKFVQKGAKEKALKEYGKLLKLDPRDAKLRLEIGDAQRRWGRLDEAIDAYTKVAEQYMDEGFDARAVAVYKQIQGLDPERWASYLPLAELYQRMGLNSEAVQSLQVAADGLRKGGDKRQSLDLLRRMASFDPTNTSSRIKVADLLCQESMNDEAIVEYESAHTELDRQGEAEAAAEVLERILEVDGDRVATLITLGCNLLARKMGHRAEPFVKRAIEIESDETSHYELLADIYRATKRDDELADTYRSLADVYRQRGDEDLARSITQRFVRPDDLGSSFDANSINAPDEEIEETLLEEEELLEDIVEPGSDPAGDAEVTVVAPKLDAAEISAPEIAIEEEVEEPLPEGDPDQLLAEASVYLRYGKRAQAIRNLKAALLADPVHRSALEKLGEAHADGGDATEAVTAWVSAAELAHAGGDVEALTVLRDRVAALDADAAAQLPANPEPSEAADESPPESVESGPALEDAPAFELDDDIEISAPDLGDDEVEIDTSGLVDDLDDDLGMSLGDAADGAGASDLDLIDSADLPATLGEAAPEAEALSLDSDDAELSLDGDADALSLDGDASVSVEVSVAEATPTAADPSASRSMTTQVNDDLEEAEFYHQQGLLDEARAIYERVLEMVPHHPLALVRMGEIDASLGDGGVAEATEAPTVTDAAESSDDLSFGSDALAIEELVELGAEASSGDAVAGESSDERGESFDAGGASQPEIVFESEPEDDDAVAEVADELFAANDAPEALAEAAVSDATAAELSLDPEEAPAESVADTAAEPGGASFDLAAELSGFFDADGESDSVSNTGVAGGAEQDVFSAVFSEFKKGVSEQLEEGDHETRYDLGIAYREMGLLEDAVAEFEIAAQGAGRQLECLHLLGLCTLDLGHGDESLTYLQAALDSVDPDADVATALRFDLGRAFESLGRIPEARQAWEAVAEVDPSFGEVEERLETLGEAKPEAAVDDEMESFEEFFEDDDDDGATGDVVAAEEHESFEDLIAEANEDFEPAVAADAAPADEAEAESDAEPEAKPRRKKKKISFV